MQFLSRKTLNYIFSKVSLKYEESKIGNFWYVILFAARVLIVYFLMGSENNIPAFLYYVASGTFFYELFKDFCSQCLETGKKRKSIEFEWDIRKYYLLYQGIIFCFYFPLLLLCVIICKLNLFKFIFFFSMGLALFTFWLFHLSAILAFISETNPEIKIIVKIGMGYLFFLTPIFWNVDYTPSRIKSLLSMLNPLAYMLEIPRYAIMPFKVDRFILTVGIILVTYIIARFLNWQDQGIQQEDGASL